LTNQVLKSSRPSRHRWQDMLSNRVLHRLERQSMLGVVSKQVFSASQIADKALGPPTTLSLVAASPGPSPDTL
jgi:hypothetical protein